MYSPVLSSLDRHSNNGYQHHHQLQLGLGLGASYDSGPSPCLKFKYFTTFLISTTCLALLSASLATHKWLVSKPIRVLRFNGSHTNMTSLMMADFAAGQSNDHSNQRHLPSALLSSLNALDANDQHGIGSRDGSMRQANSQNNKFQGEIYFGLFRGVKVLNHGLGDRVSHISGE